MSRRAFAILLLGSGVIACSASEAPARPQWLVSIATDAPPPPFFDRAVIEILDDDGNLACGAGCRRVFGFAADATWPIEIGITATPGAAHVRARVFRSDHVDPEGLPLAPMLLDGLGKLPPADGITRVALSLPMDCFGVPSDPHAHTACDPVLHTVGPESMLGPPPEPLLQVGGWPQARAVDCAAPAPEGMICIPGGVFFFGKLYVASPVIKTAPEHLVKLSPFALDRDEMTVGQIRHLIATGVLTGKVTPFAPNPDPLSTDHACTWLGAESPANDALPVTCVLRGFAELVCKRLGKRLPTEAELEWAAGNTTLETEYPWGGDPDVCSHAVVARGRTATETSVPEASSCRTKNPSSPVPFGPVAGGNPLDVTKLGVRNLAGNVAEWAADQFFADYSDPCWGSPTALSVDPRCDLDRQRLLTAATSKGGGWATQEIEARVVARRPRISTDAHAEWAPDVGFRCAQSL